MTALLQFHPDAVPTSIGAPRTGFHHSDIWILRPSFYFPGCPGLAAHCESWLHSTSATVLGAAPGTPGWQDNPHIPPHSAPQLHLCLVGTDHTWHVVTVFGAMGASVESPPCSATPLHSSVAPRSGQLWYGSTCNLRLGCRKKSYGLGCRASVSLLSACNLNIFSKTLQFKSL